MEADGLEDIELHPSYYRADAGDFYVAGDSFGPTTSPNSRRYDGTSTDVAVTGISWLGDALSFTASSGAAAVPGHITGTVKNASAAGLADIWVTAYRSDGGGGWNWANSTSTLADGSYDLGGLDAGSLRVEFRDYSDVYVTQCYNGKPNLAAGDDVAVTAGGTTSGVDATLATAGHITGTVRNASTLGLADIWVVAYRSDGAGGWDWVNGTYTFADGSYDLGGLDTSNYRIEFYDYSGNYAGQYYNGKPSLDAGDDITVTAGSTTTGVNATLTTAGHVTGTVRNASAAGLADIEVSAYRSDGAGGWDWVSYAYSSADGSYDLGGLDTGNCRIEFYDYSGTYATEYYDDKPSLDAGDDVAVTAGSTTTGVNATLATSTPLASSTGYSFAADATSGWHTTNQTVTIVATGGVAPRTIHYSTNGGGTWTAVAGDSVAVAVSSEGTHRFQFYASDVFSTETMHDAGYVNIDKTKPSTIDDVDDAAWHDAAVTVHLTPTDTASGMSGGLAKTEYSTNGGSSWTTGTTVTVATDGTTTVAYRSTDAAGNTEAPDKTCTVKIDSTAPSAISGLASTTHLVQSTWYANNTPALGWSAASDTLSGLAGYSYVVDQSAATVPDTSIETTGLSYVSGARADGVWYFHIRAVDAVGNAGPTADYALRIDTTPPTTTDDIDDDAWHDAVVTVHLTPTDTGSGMSGGLAKTEYSTNGGSSWTTGTNVTVGTSGTTTVAYRATDAAGNTEAPDKTCTVKIESTAPLTTSDADGLWHNASVTVTLTATDADSGVAYTEYSTDGGANWTHGTTIAVDPDPIGFTTEGSTTISYRSADNLGHLEAAQTCQIKLDTRRPTTKAPYKATVTRGRYVKLRYRVNDPLPNGGWATVTIKIKNAHGRVVKSLKVGKKPVNTLLSWRFRCRLAKTTYRFYVYAQDAAVNSQFKIGNNRLTVK
jgi:hypothetical protein